MRTRYDESAQRLAQQKKQRMRVIRKRSIILNPRRQIILGSLLTIAFATAMAYSTIVCLEKTWEYDATKMASYQAEMNMNREIPAEERGQANKVYTEDHYSAETIGELKATIINEHGVLIDLIVENEKLNGTSDVQPLDSNRLDETIAAYGGFKTTCEQDKVNYDGEPEDQRMSKAWSLYHTKQDVLEAELVELQQKGKYLVQDSTEYTNNLEEIENVTRKLNTIKSAFDVNGYRSLTMYFATHQTEEEGKQK